MFQGYAQETNHTTKDKIIHGLFLEKILTILQLYMWIQYRILGAVVVFIIIQKTKCKKKKKHNKSTKERELNKIKLLLTFFKKKKIQNLNTFVTTRLLHTHCIRPRQVRKQTKKKAPNVKEDEKQKVLVTNEEIFFSFSIWSVSMLCSRTTRCFYFLFLSWEHRGQYHLPLGLVVRPTHAKWNHSMEQSVLSQPIISP